MAHRSDESCDNRFFQLLSGDFLSSLVVFLVALPLCMGIAIASGVPVAAGLVTGIIGGIVVGSLSGSPLQVSGPAAGLTVIVFSLVQDHGLEMLGICVLLAGLVQISAGVLRIGQWFRAVSPAVVQGMLSGIGVLIFANQFHVMVDDQPKKSGWQNLVTIPEAIRKGLPLPELRSREHRLARTHLLREFGTLHDDQIRLVEQVGEIVPHDSLVAPPEATQTALAERLSALLPEQQRLTERIRNLRSTADMHQIHSQNGSRNHSILAAISQAEASSEAAASVLAVGKRETANQSQAQAAESLMVVQQRLKNHDWAAKVGILTILIILGWQALRIPRLRMIPAPLVAVTVVTTLSAVLSLPVLYVEIPDNLFDDLHTPSWSVLSQADWQALIGAALTLAAVASAETLLCCTAVDQMHRGARTQYDRELFAQGVGNVLCGWLGGLPMTGVIVRSAANVQAGAKTRWSAVMHGVWLLVFVALLGSVLRMIPTASLAAMLVFTGYKLMNFGMIRRLARFGNGEVAIYLATVITIVLMDLLTGVVTGIVLSALKLLFKFSRLTSDLTLRADGKTADLYLRGAATFIRLPVLAAQLEQVPPDVELHVHLEGLTDIDHACFELLMNWRQQHEAQGGKLVIDWDRLTATFGHFAREPAAMSH